MGSRASVLVSGLLTMAMTLAGFAPPAEEPSYNPDTVIDVMAAVLEVKETPRGAPLAGMHLAVSTDSETIDVYLGPTDYLKEFEITFRKGDRLEIIGSKVKAAGAPVILAREVRRNETTLYLRDRKGQPNWKSGGKAAT